MLSSWLQGCYPVMVRTGPASKGNRAWLKRSLDREKLVAYLLAVQVLDHIVGQSNLLELTEGVALHSRRTCEHHTSERRTCLCLPPPLNTHVPCHVLSQGLVKQEAYGRQRASQQQFAVQDRMRDRNRTLELPVFLSMTRLNAFKLPNGSSNSFTCT